MTDHPPVALFLLERNIPHRIFRHSNQVTSLEQAAAERNQLPDQVIRSIVFRMGEGRFVMVLAAGGGQVSWPELRRYLGQSRISMASEEEVLAATGYRIGTVAPLGLATPLRILADEAVFRPAKISIGSGERNVGIILASADLRQLLPDLEIGPFVNPAGADGKPQPPGPAEAKK